MGEFTGPLGPEATEGAEAAEGAQAADPTSARGGAAETDAAPAQTQTLSDRIHDWLPIAIVAVSVLAAVMGWRASVADEAATRVDELARQDLVSQQSTLLSKVQQVGSDLRLFGTYEQYSLLGQKLLADAGSVGGSEGQALAREGHADIEVARGLGGQLSSLPYSPLIPDNYYNRTTKAGTLQPNGTYLPGNPPAAADALTFTQSADTDLVGFEPDRLLAQASAERDKGVNFVGVAALFIAGLVFFTFAALSRGTRTFWFSGVGVVVAVIALILFPIVQFGG